MLMYFQDYIKDSDRRFAVDVVAAIALCVKNLPSVAKTCLEGLLAIVKQGVLINHFVNVFLFMINTFSALTFPML